MHPRRPPHRPAPSLQPPPPAARFRHTLHEIIFEAETPAGKFFDVSLLVLILVSLLVVSLETVEEIRVVWGAWLRATEWLLTALFTIEYLLRLSTVLRPLQYARSFFGVVDLLAILPTYLSLVIPGTHSLIVIRAVRLLRVVRVFKLVQFVGEADILLAALRGSRRKVVLFVGGVLVVVMIVAVLMYLIEGEESGFTSIPRAMYWGIVTVTTVGYGDIAPRTPVGQLLAATLMMVGYGILAVPTGIFSVELISASRRDVSTQSCPSCSAEGHDRDARYCKYCGYAL